MRLRHWWKSSRTGRFVSRIFAARHRATTFEQSAPLLGPDAERAREAMRSERRLDPSGRRADRDL